jgi:ribose-phosphate pyrophosphokinase
MSKYIALIVETLNYDNSISSLLDPADRIKKVVAKYAKEDDQLKISEDI